MVSTMNHWLHEYTFYIFSFFNVSQASAPLVCAMNHWLLEYTFLHLWPFQWLCAFGFCTFGYCKSSAYGFWYSPLGSAEQIIASARSLWLLQYAYCIINAPLASTLHCYYNCKILQSTRTDFVKYWGRWHLPFVLCILVVLQLPGTLRGQEVQESLHIPCHPAEIERRKLVMIVDRYSTYNYNLHLEISIISVEYMKVDHFFLPNRLNAWSMRVGWWNSYKEKSSFDIHPLVTPCPFEMKVNAWSY